MKAGLVFVCSPFGGREGDKKKNTTGWDIEPILKELYPHIEVQSEIINQDDLIPSLKNKDYHLVITPFEVNDKDILCIPYIEEDLYLSIPPMHYLKDKKEVSFHELDGETMLLYSNIGFWHDMHIRTMPNTKFLFQNERSTFTEIVKASTLPSFTSNLSIKRDLHSLWLLLHWPLL